MKKRTIIIISRCLFAAIAIYCIYEAVCFVGARMLINHGNGLVNKIEVYKNRYKKLPPELRDVGIDARSDDTLFFYRKRGDNVSYELWFESRLGESKIYFSDTHTWED